MIASWDWIEADYQHSPINANCDNMGIWHATQKPILLIWLSLKGITQSGGGEGDTHRTHGCIKSMPPAGSYLVREIGLHGNSPGVTAGKVAIVHHKVLLMHGSILHMCFIDISYAILYYNNRTKIYLRSQLYRYWDMSKISPYLVRRRKAGTEGWSEP